MSDLCAAHDQQVEHRRVLDGVNAFQGIQERRGGPRV